MKTEKGKKSHGRAGHNPCLQKSVEGSKVIMLKVTICHCHIRLSSDVKLQSHSNCVSARRATEPLSSNMTGEL